MQFSERDFPKDSFKIKTSIIDENIHCGIFWLLVGNR
jgi:hypothetical protein